MPTFIDAPYPVSVQVRAPGGGRVGSYRASTSHTIGLQAGTYQVELSAPDVFLFGMVRTVSLAEGDRSQLQVPAAVSIRVVAQPGNCRVSIDGRDVDFTPFSTNIVLGNHDFVFEWPALGQSKTVARAITASTDTVFERPE